MNPAPIVHDGLWRCLCPSFSANVTLRVLPRTRPRVAIERSIHSERTPPCKPQLRLPRAPNLLQTRFYRSTAPLFAYSSRKKPLVEFSTDDLYQLLRIEAAKGRYDEVQSIIKILIKDRKERPNLGIYGPLLHSFTSGMGGTAGKIRKVIEEMREGGLELDAGACHNVLEALAVHPDYLLRDEIIMYMEERWFNLTESGHNMVATGLLRDRLFEQALEKIDQMIQQNIRVQPWLYDMAMYMLLDYGEVEEAYRLLHLRLGSNTQPLSYTLWMHMLDGASRLHHSDAVEFIWDSQVLTSIIKPSTGTCLNILNMAGRTGNVRIATDVFRILAERGIMFEAHHYEALLEAYLTADDLNSAITLVVIMHEANVTFEEGTLSLLHRYLTQDETRPMAAFTVLQGLEQTGRKVPTAAVNACIRGSIYTDRLAEAIEIYKALHTVSYSGPDVETFNALFKGCERHSRKELALFFVAEMVELGIKPVAKTYDRLVRVCAKTGALDDAFAYYEEMMGQDIGPTRQMYTELVKKGCEMEDVRTPALLEHMEKLGMDARIERGLVRHAFAGKAVNGERLEGVASARFASGEGQEQSWR